MGQARYMNVRIGDAERAESVDLLTQHFTAGRLTPAEHEDRRARATTAIVRSEIETLFEDLPAPHPDMSAALPPQLTEAESRALRETKASEAWIGIAGALALLGVPAVVILGFTMGLWWLFAPLVALVIAAVVLSEVTMKPKELQD